MRFRLTQAGTLASSQNAWQLVRPALSLAMLFLLGVPLHARPSEESADDNKQTIQMLLKRIEQLEAADKQLQDRVTELERGQQKPAEETAKPVQSPTPTPSAPAAPATIPVDQLAFDATDKAESNSTLLNIRGFGDYSIHGQNLKGSNTSFSLGQIDLFITSNISERFRFVTDLVFEKNEGNDFEEDLERVLLEYRYSDYLKLELGRNHTAIGYYNLAFRHSSWWQTPTGRPYLFLFEDEGGILPGHIVGASASGAIPSGKFGLHYIAEVGNGRSATPGAEPVQNFTDENTHKAVDFNLFARPEFLPGLQVGFSAYRDLLTPPNAARIDETILDSYFVVQRSKFEWLNEGLLIRHAPQGTPHVFNTPGFYTQISEGFGSFRPYFRYQYVNAPDNEPIFYPVYHVAVGLQHGPSLGVRYDFTESVAAKLQYDYNSVRRVQGVNQPSISQLALQVTFAF